MSGRTTYRQKCRHEVPAYNASMDPHPERLRAAQRRRRHIIKNSGATQHHDQLTGRFEHNGDTQVIFWNQGDKTLYLAEIPANPQQSP